MKLIIDIDDTTYDRLKQIYNPEIGMLSPTYGAVVNGTPFDVLDEIRAEIEEKYEKYKYLFDTDFMGTKDLEWVLSVIDKYRNEVSE